jgi:branched-subunit amino acid ABC-type transport system permease component
MSDLLPFVIVGLTNGSLYGLAGMGLVLTYSTSGVFNFAHGGIAAVGAFAFFELHERYGLPWPLALVISVLGVGVGFGLVLEPLTRALKTATAELTIVATVGLLLLLQGGLTAAFGSSTRPVEQFLPTSGFRLAGVQIQYAQVLTMLGGAVLAAGLYLLIRRSRAGAEMRAVVDDPSLLSLTGGDPVRVRMTAWIIGSALAALSGILIAPLLGLDAFLLTLLIVQAFGACALGRFSSLPATYAGGLAVGLAAALVTKAVATTPALSGLPPSVPFFVLFAVLVVTPPRRLAVVTHRAAGQQSPAAVRGAPRRTGAVVAAAGVVALVAAPFVVGARLPLYTNALTFALIFLSLALLVITSGQVSLAHAAFAAVGATTFSHLTVGVGLPWGVALLLAGLATVPVGVAVALPAIRLSGIYLALATFGLGILFERVLYSRAVMFGTAGYRAAPRPDLGLFDGRADRAFYFVVLGVVIAACGVVALLLRSRFGRLLRALGDAPTALVTQGLVVNTTRILVFCLSGILAGLGGGLLVASPGLVSPVGFGPFESLTWVVVLAIAGRRALPAAFAAAGLMVLFPAYLPDSVVEHRTLGFGALALIAVCLQQLDWRAWRRPDRARRSPVRARHTMGAAWAGEAAR